MVHPTHCRTVQPVTVRGYMLRTISSNGEWTELAAAAHKSTPDGDFRVQKLHLSSPDPELQFTSSASCNDHLSVRLRTYLTTRQWCTGLPVGDHDRDSVMWVQSSRHEIVGDLHWKVVAQGVSAQRYPVKTGYMSDPRLWSSKVQDKVSKEWTTRKIHTPLTRAACTHLTVPLTSR